MTLSSIINSTTHDDQKRIHIVVAVSFLNQTCALEVKHTVNEMFDTYVKSGLVELIGIPVEAYPPLHNLRKTYDDDEIRVRWRSIQNIDYSYLMAYNVNRSTYYIQLEDDVTTNSGYLKAIEQFINDTTEYWAMLEFSSLGFIGKLFRSSDLHKIANLLRTFYAEHPCDFLMIHFMKLMIQDRRMLKIPTLFQHHGIQSSLPNLTRNISDRFYATVTKTIKGDNPSADIYTSLKQYKLHEPANAYNNNVAGFFWALPPKVGDTLVVAFKRPQCLKRFALSSGFHEKGDDKIASGVVEVGTLIKSLTGDTVNRFKVYRGH
ncbi:alpha-1,3-mannosyl-glycoprotein 4-beta-N-acetylglucosaminyltransferase C-like [Argopecten irradians]|uniref:alpha-1,3-mannosyl-glycoprotein 4-beta-N-acetylglucosaminyltransferase C-like n=1 Tax=Argopecten irradians TaxID=31199 RepID=UPI00371922D2